MRVARGDYSPFAPFAISAFAMDRITASPVHTHTHSLHALWYLPPLCACDSSSLSLVFFFCSNPYALGSGSVRLIVTRRRCGHYVYVFRWLQSMKTERERDSVRQTTAAVSRFSLLLEKKTLSRFHERESEGVRERMTAHTHTYTAARSISVC